MKKSILGTFKNLLIHLDKNILILSESAGSSSAMLATGRRALQAAGRLLDPKDAAAGALIHRYSD
jgi:hypothetical protein